MNEARLLRSCCKVNDIQAAVAPARELFADHVPFLLPKGEI